MLGASPWSSACTMVCRVVVGMWLPPAAPVTKATLPSLRVAIIGEMEDRGRFPGLMKLFGFAGYPMALVVFGVEKSKFVRLGPE